MVRERDKKIDEGGDKKSPRSRQAHQTSGTIGAWFRKEERKKTKSRGRK